MNTAYEDMLSTKHAAEFAIREAFDRKYGFFQKCHTCGAFYNVLPATTDCACGGHLRFSSYSWPTKINAEDIDWVHARIRASLHECLSALQLVRDLRIYTRNREALREAAVELLARRGFDKEKT